VWEAAGDGALDTLLEPLPDEFHAWATKIADGLREEAAALAVEVEAAYEATLASLPEGWGRKEFAIAVSKHPARSCLFLRLDDKDYRGLLWQRVRPKVTEEES
jgi:RNA ligase